VRIVLPGNAVKLILLWTQRVLFAGALALLGYVGFVQLDGWMYQRREVKRLEQVLANVTVPHAGVPRPPLMANGAIGKLEVPRLGVSVMVAEGVDPAALGRAAGHIPGTALPGQPGNSATSAHRDTFFRPLRNVRRDDEISVTTPGGAYSYRVVSTRIVDPSNVSVLDASATEVLTLVTCYPFYYSGAAPQRFIVRAERMAVPAAADQARK
jgi:sortase A